MKINKEFFEQQTPDEIRRKSVKYCRNFSKEPGKPNSAFLKLTLIVGVLFIKLIEGEYNRTIKQDIANYLHVPHDWLDPGIKLGVELGILTDKNYHRNRIIELNVAYEKMRIIKDRCLKEKTVIDEIKSNLKMGLKYNALLAHGINFNENVKNLLSTINASIRLLETHKIYDSHQMESIAKLCENHISLQNLKLTDSALWAELGDLFEEDKLELALFSYKKSLVIEKEQKNLVNFYTLRDIVFILLKQVDVIRSRICEITQIEQLKISNLYKEAISRVKEALHLCPDNAYGWNLLGYIWHHQHQFLDAIQCFQQALEYDAGYTQARRNKFFNHIMESQTNEAQKEIEYLRKNREFDPYDYNLIGNAFLREGYLDKATQMYNQFYQYSDDKNKELTWRINLFRVQLRGGYNKKTKKEYKNLYEILSNKFKDTGDDYYLNSIFYLLLESKKFHELIEVFNKNQNSLSACYICKNCQNLSWDEKESVAVDLFRTLTEECRNKVNLYSLIAYWCKEKYKKSLNPMDKIDAQIYCSKVLKQNNKKEKEIERFEKELNEIENQSKLYLKVKEVVENSGYKVKEFDL